MPTIAAVCVVRELRPDAGTFGVTAIDKRGVAEPVFVGPYGVRGDVQVDRKHHGGLEQALYLYSAADAAFWASELGRELHPGWFGENLLIDGLDVNEARVGERWRIGGEVEIEFTSARVPCATFARWVGGADERGWVKRFAAAERYGAYAKVIAHGQLAAGDVITVESVPDASPTIRESFRWS